MRKLLIAIPLLAAAAWAAAPAVRGHGSLLRIPKHRARSPEPEAIPADPAPAAPLLVSSTPKTAPAAVIPAGLGRASAWPASLGFARLLAEDPEERARLIEELGHRRADADSGVRHLAEILLAELEMGWEAAAFTHADPEVRIALLAQPPERTEVIVDRLIDAASMDPDPAVRAAALRGLHAGLDAESTVRVAACLRDRDPSVSRAAIAVLRSAKALDPAALTELRNVALGTGGDDGARGAARRAILKFEKDLSASDQEALERALSGR